MDNVLRLSSIVRQMFEEAGIAPQCPDKNSFLTVIGGVHCRFRTILRCEEKNPARLSIHASFPIPVPEHIAGVVQHELIRLNVNNKYQSKITMQKKVTCILSLSLPILTLRKPRQSMR